MDRDVDDPRVCCVQGIFDLVRKVVAGREAQIAIGLGVQVDDDGVGSSVGADTMAVIDTFHSEHDLLDEGDISLGNIDQHAEIRADDGPGHVQDERIKDLEALIRNQRLDGIPLPSQTTFDTLQSKAIIFSNKADDGSGIVGEIIQAIPYIATLKFH